jgi:hypothetical protein
LKQAEFFDERLMKTFDALSERFGKPLNLNVSQITAGHKASAALVTPQTERSSPINMTRHPHAAAAEVREAGPVEISA